METVLDNKDVERWVKSNNRKFFRFEIPVDDELDDCWLDEVVVVDELARTTNKLSSKTR